MTSLLVKCCKVVILLFSFITAAMFCISASGVLRSISGLSLEYSLVAMLPLVALQPFLPGFGICQGPILRHSTISAKRCWILLSICLVSVIIFAIRNKFSLVTSGNADSYFHHVFAEQFFTNNPAAYNRFVTLYTLIYWFMYVSGGALTENYVVLLYAGFILLTFWILLTTTLTASVKSGRSSQVLIKTLWKIFLLLFLALPIYFQFTFQGGWAHGFWMFLFPLAGILYASGASLVIRTSILISLATFLRFSYGLNLPDILNGAAVLLLLDLPLCRSKKGKALVLAIIAVLFSAGLYSLYKLWPIINNGGAGTRLNVPSIWLALSCVSGAAFWIYKRTEEAHLRYYCRFVAVLLLVTVFHQVIFMLQGVQFRYYDMKYVVYAAILGISFLAVAPELLSETGQIRALLFKSLIAGSLLCFCFGLHKYIQKAYISETQTLVNFQEIEAIEEVLSSSGKPFKGFITHNWPRFRIVNHRFGNQKLAGRKNYLKLAPSIFELDGCIFWQDRKAHRHRLALVMKNRGNHKIVKKLRLARTRLVTEGKIHVLRSKAINDSHIGYVCGYQILRQSVAGSKPLLDYPQ